MCSSEQFKAAAEAEKIVSVLLSEMLVMSQNLCLLQERVGRLKAWPTPETEFNRVQTRKVRLRMHEFTSHLELRTNKVFYFEAGIQ